MFIALSSIRTLYSQYCCSAIEPHQFLRKMHDIRSKHDQSSLQKSGLMHTIMNIAFLSIISRIKL